MKRQLTASGRNPDYSPLEDAIDAIAEHLREDDSAYEDSDEAERQARRIVDAVQRRGLRFVIETEQAGSSR